jgi:hypothetical protein
MKESLIAHYVDTHDLAHDDGVSVGGCCNQDCSQGREGPIQYAGREPEEEYDDPRGGMVVAAMAVFSVALVFFALVIAYIISS